MNTPSKDLRERNIEQIIARKMGKIYDWKEPQVVKTVGPFFPDAFKQYTDEVQNIHFRLKERLQELSLEELQLGLDLNFAVRETPINSMKSWSTLFNREINALTRSIPSWFSAGLGHPDFVTDLAYWPKMPRFALDEILLLSVGVDPRRAEVGDMIKEFRTTNLTGLEVLDFIADRSNLFSRQFNPRGHKGALVLPEHFLDFVDRVDLDVEQGFLRELTKIHRPAKRMTSNQLDTRERDSLLKMICVMAMDGYGFDPKSKRSSIPKELSEIAQRNEIQITSDTIRKHLYASSEFFEEPWKTD